MKKSALLLESSKSSRVWGPIFTSVIMAGAARMEPDSSSASDLVAPLTLLMLAEPQHRHTNRGIMTCGSSFLNTSWVPLLSGCLTGKNGFTSHNSPGREVHFLISRLHRWARTEAERNWVFYPSHTACEWQRGQSNSSTVFWLCPRGESV